MDYDKIAQQYGGQVVSGQRASRVGELAVGVEESKKEAGKSVARRFLSELPGQAADVILKNPAKLAYSGAMAPIDIGRQITGNKPVGTELPLIGKTFQADAQSSLDQGENPLFVAGKAALEVPMAGLEALGVGKAVKAVPSMFKTTVAKVSQKLTDKAEKKALDFSLELTSPKITTQGATSAIEQGRTTAPKVFGKSKILPTPKDNLVAESVSGIVSPNKNMVENVDAISQRVSQINQGVRGLIANNKTPFNEKQLRAKLNASKDDNKLVFASDATAERTYNAVVDEFMKHVRTKDTLGLFEARQEFDKVPAIKKLLETERLGENTRRQIVLDVRRAANEYVADQLPLNNPYRRALTQESRMLEAIGNIAEKNASTIGMNKLQIWTKEHPVLKWVVGSAGVGILGGAGVGVGGSIIDSTN